MAKKQKRPVRKEANPSVEKPVVDPLLTNRPTGFNPDYEYVIRDLRRVGILAGSFVIVLLALAILIH
jgi:hypothetical protein